MKYPIWIIPALLFLGGCGGNIFRTISSGNSDFLIKTEKEVSSSGETIKSIETISGNVKQPSPSEDSAKIIVTKTNEGEVSITTTTGTSQDISGIQKIISSTESLQPLIFSGIGLIITAAISFLIFKNYKVSLIIAGTGIGLIILGSLLIQYSLYFLVGAIVITLGFISYIVYKSRISVKTAEENVVLIDQLKKEIEPTTKEKYFGSNGIAQAIQSTTTQKTVKAIRKKNNSEANT